MEISFHHQLCAWFNNSISFIFYSSFEKKMVSVSIQTQKNMGTLDNDSASFVLQNNLENKKGNPPTTLYLLRQPLFISRYCNQLFSNSQLLCVYGQARIKSRTFVSHLF
jgi:hypothetical protein